MVGPVLTVPAVCATVGALVQPGTEVLHTQQLLPKHQPAVPCLHYLPGDFIIFSWDKKHQKRELVNTQLSAKMCSQYNGGVRHFGVGQQYPIILYS